MKYLMLCLAILILPACTTTKPIGTSGSELQMLNQNNRLQLTNKVISVNTKQNTITDAKVLSTTQDSLITNKGEIRFDDIQGLAVKQVSVGKTVAAATGGLVVGAVAIGTVIAVGTGVLVLAYLVDGP